MSDVEHQDRQLSLPDSVRALPAHRIPTIIGRRAVAVSERGTWSRIFGLIHKLGSDEDDGPISRIRY